MTSGRPPNGEVVNPRLPLLEYLSYPAPAVSPTPAILLLIAARRPREATLISMKYSLSISSGSPKVERAVRSEEHTSELQSRGHLVCRLLLEKKNKIDSS